MNIFFYYLLQVFDYHVQASMKIALRLTMEFLYFSAKGFNVKVLPVLTFK